MTNIFSAFPLLKSPLLPSAQEPGTRNILDNKQASVRQDSDLQQEKSSNVRVRRQSWAGQNPAPSSDISQQIFKYTPGHFLAPQTPYFKEITIPLENNFSPLPPLLSVYSLNNARGKTFEQLLSDPSLNQIAGFSGLTAENKRLLLKKRFDDLGIDTQYPIGSFEHALASAIKKYDKFGTDIQAGTGFYTPRGKERYQSLEDLMATFVKVCLHWKDKQELGFPHPARLVSLPMAQENGHDLTGKDPKETLYNAERHLVDQWNAHGGQVNLEGAFGYDLADPPSHIGEYYNKALNHWMPNYIQTDKIPGPDYTWHGFLNDLKEAARAPFTELGKEFWKITHGGYISPEKAQEIEKYGKWIDLIIGIVPDVQTAKMIATAAAEGLDSLTKAINGIRDKPLTKDEIETLRSNYENFATSLGSASRGNLTHTSTIPQPTPGPRTVPPPSFKKMFVVSRQTVDARGQPAFHGTINGRSVYLTLDPQSTPKEGFYRETAPVTGKQIGHKKYARIGNSHEFQEISLKGGMKEGDDLPGTSKSVVPKRPSDQAAGPNSKKIKTLEPTSGSIDWSEYLREDEPRLKNYSDQAEVRQAELYAENNTSDALDEYEADQDKEGVDYTLVTLYTQHSNEYFNNHFRYDGAPGKIDNPESIGHLADILELLPQTGGVTLYRGGSGGRGTSGEHFRTGKIKVGDGLVNTDFTSFTENPYLPKHFFGGNTSGESGQYHYDDTSVVFVLENPQDARAIMPLSITPEEAESLYTPGHHFIVKDIKILSINGRPLVQVHIEEGRSSGNMFDFRTGEPFDRQMMEKRIGSKYTERFFNE